MPRYLLKSLSNEQLLKRKDDRLALLELLGRPGLTDVQRRETMQTTAQLEKVDESQVIRQVVQTIDTASAAADVEVAVDLLKSLKGLKSGNGVLQHFALTARRGVVRDLAFASIVNFEGSSDSAWKLALESNNPAQSLKNFVECVPYLSDASVRAGLYDRIAPLLDGLPKSLGGTRAPRERPTEEDSRATAAFEIRRAAMTRFDTNSRTGSRNVPQAGPIRTGRCGPPRRDSRPAIDPPKLVA